MIATAHVSASSGRNFREFRREPCPICTKVGWCRQFADGAIECMRVESSTVCKSGGWMHWPNGRPHDWREQLAAIPPRETRPAVDVAASDQAYRALLARCPLSDDHRTHLLNRGLTAEEITRHGYATLPGDHFTRRRIAAAVEAALGWDPAGVVPGFIRRNGVLSLVNIPGILIPFPDECDRLVGIQVRADDPTNGKYRWLSAGDGPGSIAQDGHAVLVARPLRETSHHRVGITEGGLKARLAAERLGITMIAVAGVANTGHVVETLTAIGGVEEVITFYDEDPTPNAHVIRAEARLAHDIDAAGFSALQATWPKEAGKGIDDIIGANPPTIPIARPHPALAAARPSEPDPELGERLTRLQTERNAAIDANQFRARIQRNRKLPARPMAVTVVNYLTQAATASQPAGRFTGKVPAGFMLAPVKEAAFDAGTTSSNAGKQLDDLEKAGLLSRLTLPENLPAGTINPQTGKPSATPLRISHHFIAIPGREHEPITLPAVRALGDRMAAYDSGKRDARGGKRIPRCKHHPDAPVIREFIDVCSVCRAVVNDGAHELPAALLEPATAVEQTLMDRDDDEAPPASDANDAEENGALGYVPHTSRDDATVEMAVEQTLLDRDDASTPDPHDGARDRNMAPLGIRTTANEDRATADIAVEQTLLDRPAPDVILIDHEREARRARAAADLAARYPRLAPEHEAGDHAPELLEAQAVIDFASRATDPLAGKRAREDLGEQLARIATERGRSPVPKPGRPLMAEADLDPWEAPPAPSYHWTTD